MYIFECGNLTVALGVYENKKERNKKNNYLFVLFNGFT